MHEKVKNNNYYVPNKKRKKLGFCKCQMVKLFYIRIFLHFLAGENVALRSRNDMSGLWDIKTVK